MGEEQICKCGEVMENLGNISNMIYTSYPAQWDDVYVCHKCKAKKTVRVIGQLPPDNSHLDNYTELT